MNELIKKLLDMQDRITKGDVDEHKKNIRVRDVKARNDTSRVCKVFGRA